MGAKPKVLRPHIVGSFFGCGPRRKWWHRQRKKVAASMKCGGQGIAAFSKIQNWRWIEVLKFGVPASKAAFISDFRKSKMGCALTRGWSKRLKFFCFYRSRPDPEKKNWRWIEVLKFGLPASKALLNSDFPKSGPLLKKRKKSCDEIFTPP